MEMKGSEQVTVATVWSGWKSSQHSDTIIHLHSTKEKRRQGTQENRQEAKMLLPGHVQTLITQFCKAARLVQDVVAVGETRPIDVGDGHSQVSIGTSIPSSGRPPMRPLLKRNPASPLSPLRSYCVHISKYSTVEQPIGEC